MRVQETDLPGVLLIRPRRFADERGWFCEQWSSRTWADGGMAEDFVQDNLSLTRRPGTVRGLHYQIPPMAQGKLVQVVRGRVLDVVLDVRRHALSFGRHLAIELSDEGGEQLYIPPGFAHGFCTLEPDVLFSYKVTAHYSPAHERSIRWDDPDLSITWPVDPHAALLSPRDGLAPLLRDQADLFEDRP